MIIAKAPTLTILLPIYDHTGVMRFPNSGGPYFGIHCVLDAARPLAEQAITAIERFFDHSDLGGKLEPVTVIDPVLKADDRVSSLLYLVRPTEPFIEADPAWFPIAQVLRSLDRGPTRVAYMKALQYLAGAAEADVSVLEVDAEVRRRLKELASESPETLVE